MEKLTCRLLPFSVASGPSNMATDEVLLQSAAKGIASLRLYGWKEATLSLGYFQPSGVRMESPLEQLPWVRRPSGGGALVHHHEWTYALALPPTHAPRKENWLEKMHLILAAALHRLHPNGDLRLALTAENRGNILCFEQVSPGDLLCQGTKIAGSAQRRQHGCLLQHGAILLAKSRYTPTLPGLEDLTGQVFSLNLFQSMLIDEFSCATGWELAASSLSQEEKESLARLAWEKYERRAWNEKR